MDKIHGQFLVQYHTKITTHIYRLNDATAIVQRQAHALDLPQVNFLRKSG